MNEQVTITHAELADEWRVGRLMQFRFWPPVYRTVHIDGSYVMYRGVVLFGKWLVRTSRKWKAEPISETWVGRG